MRGVVRRTAVLGALSGTMLGVGPAAAQDILDIDAELLQEVMPEAERFGDPLSDPPVLQGFAVDAASGQEVAVGFVFMTSDIPPETAGYSAPIDVLVGMDLGGTVTGIEIIDYRESLRRSRGDFLDRGSYLQQFTGKHVTEPFRLRTDIDGISGASISVDAMSRGIRNAARRVAAAYLSGAPDEAPSYIATIPFEELEGLLWAEMLDRRLAVQVDLLDAPSPVALFLMYLRDPAIGDMMVGETAFQAALDTLGVREDEHLMLMGLSGNGAFFFNSSQISFVQEPDTIAVDSDDLVMLPLLTEGRLQGEVRRSGVLWADGALDITRPFEVVLNLAPREGVGAIQYVVTPPTTVASAGTAGGGGEPSDTGQASTDDVDPAGPAGATSGSSPGGGPGGGEPSGPPGAGAAGGSVGMGPQNTAGAPPDQTTATQEPIDYEALLFEDEMVEQSALERVLERTSWPRVAGFLVLLTLVTWALVAKGVRLRWITLTATLFLLGWVDGGFLSVSHIMAGITVGPEVYVEDLPLLLLVAFTVVTTLLFGRVFCGFLCPFGALQDFMERIVPKRFRRELPKNVHEKALWVKYGILGVVLAPALVGSSLSLFQYFEPFGTVFYWSPSLLLWSIAGTILLASAVVPRFYCRYACPLGAALAIGSLLAPFRIRRVEQCTVCKVCEQKCPTGAITGPAIDFKECVRCNTCEIQLIEKTGVCQHDMVKIRRRLVKLPMAAGPAGDLQPAGGEGP